MRSFSELISLAKAKGPRRVVLVGSEDREGIKALKFAFDEGIAVPVFVGDEERTNEILDEEGLKGEVMGASSSEEACEKGIRLVNSGYADIVLKGLVKTSTLLKAVLNKEWGLRSGKILSHIAALEVPAIDRIVFVTDGGMVIRPDLPTKISIIENAVSFLKSLGYEKPKVALVAAVETVNEDMPETLEAAVISKMGQRGQIIDCEIDGPLGIDNALSSFAAEVKKVTGPVAGRADLLVVPDIASGNFLGKSAVYFAGGKIAGLILGASAPIVIVSRADSSPSKLASIALASYSLGEQQ
ncbi:MULTISPECIES: bifunctional enoyl-CoA hydratase/phosphate acetyltransferase [unclassified Mesotoga]|uniref:bifunctional enoyl-CoA hydratase/phosphate acetyltransferase n=1 Tax=unclassified Mesotoga TaxID=1184398 RepID=UPI000DA686ED|nr:MULTISPECIES: bifunctional enoyl-CoA hydratase/phosphate acetyltransferase [unclassified Mesotoga]PZC53010.1 phosphate butyryltransferase [Mesotoga sp. TolDC]